MKTQIEIMTLNKDLVCRKYATPNKTQKLLKTPAYPEWLIGLIQLLYLPENFIMPVSEIVETTFYSHATVAKTFKNYFGVTLNDYAMNLRLEHAAELLKKTSDTVLRVCSLCGYDSLSYFIKQFKKKVRRYAVTIPLAPRPIVYFTQINLSPRTICARGDFYRYGLY